MSRIQTRSPSPEEQRCSVLNEVYNMTTMGKESSLEGLKFDGDTVLCRVCGDKASGFHYGVHACEGCKGFFRRSIQQKIQYRPCLKNQQCNIMRVNRNRCQYCRLKKCISVGMSRDAVRFGRVPKKEKARIIEQMQRVNGHSQSTLQLSLLESENVGDLVQAVIDAHRQTCDFSIEKINTLRKASLYTSKYVNCPAHMACPLDNVQRKDSNENKQDVEDFPQYFAPAVTSAVDFARLIPGFFILNQEDQITLLKAGTFEVLLIRLANLFDPATNTMMFTNGQLFKRQSAVSNTVGYLMDSMFDFAERFNKLQLTEGELALFSAVVLLSPDRPGLRNSDQVERIQNKLNQGLQDLINTNHRDDSTLFAKLLMKMTDLRTLNTLHSEKSIGSFDGECKEATDDHTDMECDMRSETSSPPSDASSFTNNNTVSLYSLESESPDSTCASSVISQRMPQETHQQVVLRTPYGTFYREETSGFYGFFHDQPRQRCHTLDRDTLTRPRLHRIDEGTRRRNTMDREYISKMAHSLGERLEKRNAVLADSVPPSITSSAASSPIPEDKLYNNREFTPISTADSQSTCASPLSREHLIPFSPSPNSSDPRSRSGSLSADDYQSRPRCYSFNMNSEGRASRKSFTRPVITTEIHDSQQYLSADTRRGSVGASYGLHARKSSLQVDRNSTYLGPSIEELVKRCDDPVQLGDAAKLQQHHFPLEDPATLANMKNGGMQHIISTLTQAWQPVVNPYGNIPSQLAKGSQGSIAPSSHADENSARNPGTKIVVSDHSQAESLETFPHKKFDKIRKHLQSSTSGNSEAASVEIHMKDVKEKSPEKTEPHLTEKHKSAGEAHPQLLAQLKTTTPSMLHYRPITSCQVLANGVRAIQISKPEPNTQPSLKQADLASTAAEIKEALHCNSKEQAHAVALSHLKDKLLRKYDSMENLQKIAGEQTADGAKTERSAPVTNVHVVSYPGVPASHPVGVMPNHRGGIPAYQYFYPAAGQQVPMYNQHLAGMQQMTQMYPNSGQLVRAIHPEGGLPLNLVLKLPDGSCPIPTNVTAAHVISEPVWGKK